MLLHQQRISFLVHDNVSSDEIFPVFFILVFGFRILFFVCFEFVFVFVLFLVYYVFFLL